MLTPWPCWYSQEPRDRLPKAAGVLHPSRGSVQIPGHTSAQTPPQINASAFPGMGSILFVWNFPGDTGGRKGTTFAALVLPQGPRTWGLE